MRVLLISVQGHLETRDVRLGELDVNPCGCPTCSLLCGRLDDWALGLPGATKLGNPRHSSQIADWVLLVRIPKSIRIQLNLLGGESIDAQGKSAEHHNQRRTCSLLRCEQVNAL